MPRKRSDDKEQSEGYNKAFPSTLRKMMRERNVTQQMLTDYLGKKNRQTVSYYCDGTSSPDWETLVKIADYFDISMDYLLGRTADPSRTPCATDELGLTPENVSYLVSPGEAMGKPKTTKAFANLVHNLVNDIIGACLECHLDSDYMLMQNFTDRYIGKKRIKVQSYGYDHPLPDPWAVQNYIEAHSLFVLPAQEGADYYAHKLGDKIAQYIIDKRVTPYLKMMEIMETIESCELLEKSEQSGADEGASNGQH